MENKKKFTQISLKGLLEDLQLPITSEGIKFKLDTIPSIELECCDKGIGQALTKILCDAYSITKYMKGELVELSMDVNSSPNFLTFFIRATGRDDLRKINFAAEIENEFRSSFNFVNNIAEEHGGEFFLDGSDSIALFVFKIPITHSLRQSSN